MLFSGTGINNKDPMKLKAFPENRGRLLSYSGLCLLAVIFVEIGDGLDALVEIKQRVILVR